MSSTVVLPSEFKIENVSFNTPKKNSQGGQSVLISYYNEATDKSGPLILQTPRCRAPFGAEIVDAPDKKSRKYSINISLSNSESTNENLKKFTEIIRAIDDKAKKYCRGEGAMSWFGKVHSEEMVNELYKSAIKRSKNEKYPPTLKVKLPVKVNGDKLVPQFDVYNDKKDLIPLVSDDGTDVDLSCFPGGSELTGIIQCTGVWFVGSTSFGIAFKCVQTKVSSSNKLVGYQIVDEEDLVEDEEDEEVG